jgi:methylated-DNA-[protein]-cysteine S-methyltransferase
MNRIYEFTSQIPAGRITTYGILAKAIGKPRTSRWVGQILKRNPNPVVIPCHRVVLSNGQVGEYFLGTKVKINLLTSEGIVVKKGKILNFYEKLFDDFNFKNCQNVNISKK